MFVSDTTVFTASKFYTELDTLVPDDKAFPSTSTSMPHVLVADEAFPLKRHIMRPYSRANLDSGRVAGADYQEMAIYNYRLSRLENIIYHVIVILSRTVIYLDYKLLSTVNVE